MNKIGQVDHLQRILKRKCQKTLIDNINDKKKFSRNPFGYTFATLNISQKLHL